MRLCGRECTAGYSISGIPCWIQYLRHSRALEEVTIVRTTESVKYYWGATHALERDSERLRVLNHKFL